MFIELPVNPEPPKITEWSAVNIELSLAIIEELYDVTIFEYPARIEEL